MSTGAGSGKPTGAGAGTAGTGIKRSATIGTFEKVEGALYQDENIAILPPDDPRGVELMHVIGYLDPIVANSVEKKNINERALKNIGNVGLKSSARLLTNAGIYVPKEFNEDIPDESIYSESRKKYLRYDPSSLSRIYFRPPSTAPFRLEGGRLVSAGNWRHFLRDPREHPLFFNGESYTDSMEHTSEKAAIALGIITIRVDPEHTYLFDENIKDIQNRNHETGIPHPPQEPEQRQTRYRESRIKLSDLLDFLQENPGKVEDKYEAVATTDLLPSSYFDKFILRGKREGEIIINGEIQEDLSEEDEDVLIKQKDKENYKRRIEQGDAMQAEAKSILKPLLEKSKAISEAAGDLNDQLNAEIKTVELKRGRVQTALDHLQSFAPLTLDHAKAEAKELLDKFRKPNKGPGRTLHPIQKEWIEYSIYKEIFPKYTYGMKAQKRAEEYLAKTPSMVPSQLTVARLKEELAKRGLDTTGLKAVLLARFEEALAAESSAGAGAGSGSGAFKGGRRNTRRIARKHSRKTRVHRV